MACLDFRAKFRPGSIPVFDIAVFGPWPGNGRDGVRSISHR